MLIKLLIFATTLLLLSCSDSNVTKDFDNSSGGIGRNNSYEFVDGFQYQIRSEILIDSLYGTTCPPHELANQKIIMASENSSIVSLFSNEKEWEYNLDSGHVIGSGFASDKSNNIYTIDNYGTAYSIDSDGNQRFKIEIIEASKLEFFNTPLSLPNSIIFSSSNGDFVSVDTNGKENYRLKFDTDIIGEVSALNENNILVTLTNGTFGATDTLVCLDSFGKEKWRFSSDGYRYLKGAITNGINIAVGGTKQLEDNKLSKVFYLDSTGKENWDKEISSLPRFLSMSNDGELFVITYDSGFRKMLSGVFSYSSTGDLNWNIYYDYSIPTPAWISGNIISFLASNRETYGLFYLNKDDGVLMHSLDIGEAAPIEFTPAIGDDGTINFSGKDQLRLIRIDETAISKILPY